MAQTLSRLLGDDAKQRLALYELRKMAQDDSDVRLIADILARAHSIIRSLGLDPRDTTAEEIYQSLQAIAPRVEQWAPFRDSDWVLLDIDGRVISFHPVDVVNNYHHQLPLGKHQTAHGKRGLGFEIARRYKEHPRTHTVAVERVVCEGGICHVSTVTVPVPDRTSPAPTGKGRKKTVPISQKKSSTKKKAKKR